MASGTYTPGGWTRVAIDPHVYTNTIHPVLYYSNDDTIRRFNPIEPERQTMTTTTEEATVVDDVQTLIDLPVGSTIRHNYGRPSQYRIWTRTETGFETENGMTVNPYLLAGEVQGGRVTITHRAEPPKDETPQENESDRGAREVEGRGLTPDAASLEQRVLDLQNQLLERQTKWAELEQALHGYANRTWSARSALDALLEEHGMTPRFEEIPVTISLRGSTNVPVVGVVPNVTIETVPTVTWTYNLVVPTTFRRGQCACGVVPLRTIRALLSEQGIEYVDWSITGRSCPYGTPPTP